MAEKSGPLGFVAYNVRTGENKILNIPYRQKNLYNKNQLFPPIGELNSHIFYPYVVGQIADKMVVWRIGYFKKIMEIPFPVVGKYNMIVSGAMYLPE